MKPNEIANTLITIDMESRGGNSPYGWSSDAYHVRVAGVIVHTASTKAGANAMASTLKKAISKVLQ
jgi:hypothetical protein